MSEGIVAQTGLLKGLGRQVDQVAITLQRFKNAALSTHIGGLAVLAGGIHKTSKASQGLFKTGKEQLKQYKAMTISGKLLHNTVLKHTRTNRIATGVYRMLNTEKMAAYKHTQRLLMGFTSLIGSVMTIFSISMTLILALSMLSIAFQGANTPLLDMTANMGALHDVVEGLVLALSGEGGGSLLDVFLAALVIGTGVALLFSATIGIVVAGLIVAGGVYHYLKDSIVGVTGALIAAGASFGVFVAWIVSGISIVTAPFFSVLLPGFMAIMGGIALLVSVASGAGSTLWAIVRTVVGGILIAVGLIVLGVSAPIAAVVAIIAGAVALIIRYRNEIWDGIVWFVTGIISTLGDLKDWIANSRLFGGLVDSWNWVKNNINPLQWLSDLYQWFEEGLGNLKDLIFGLGGQIADAVASIPGASLVGDAIGAIGGIFGRADGGPVTGGQPYIVGERGPELFTPGTSGNITPNHEMGGQSITMNINVSGVTDRSDKRALAREIGDMLSQELRRQGGSPTRGRF